MRKFCFGVLTVASIASIVGPAAAQTPSTPLAGATSDNGQSVAPAGAHSYIVNLKDGDTVTSPLKVVFGLSPNMGVAPAGVEKPNVGHHHLLIDTTLSPDEMTQPIIADEQHVHFGKGQTETTVKLLPGKHTLQLVLANWTHIPFTPPVQSDVITITVKAEGAAKVDGSAKVDGAAKAEAIMPAPTAKSRPVKHAFHHGHHHHHHHYYQYVRYLYVK